KSSGQRMERLIGDLLDAAALDQGGLSIERTSTPVKPLLDEVLELFSRRAAEAQLTLRLAAPSESLCAYADGGRVVQALSNLVGNAIKFTPEGGSIEFGAADDAGEVRFWVTDTGPGIRPELIPH